MGRQAAEILLPIYEKTNGEKGFLSLQVNPKNNRDPEKMYHQAIELASFAPNIAIKLPATELGLEVAERLIAQGISVNTTVSFSVAQAVAAAEAIERGLDVYARTGNDDSKIHPYVTIMTGRVGDYLGRIAEKENLVVYGEDTLTLSGVFVFKKAAKIFKDRGFRSTLLAAAYRHEHQWSRIIGSEVLQSIPYPWWQKFRQSNVNVRETLWEDDDEAVLNKLNRTFPDFRKVYDENGMTLEDFQTFEASVATLDQFIEGYNKLLLQVENALSNK